MDTGRNKGVIVRTMIIDSSHASRCSKNRRSFKEEREEGDGGREEEKVKEEIDLKLPSASGK